MDNIIKRDIEEIVKSSPKISGKKILITGGAGFIGSYLCDFLIASGNKVICLDDLSSGNRENIKHLLKNKNFSFIKADVCRLPKLPKVDYIFHLASVNSPAAFKKYALNIFLTNVLGTKILLDMAYKWNAKFFFASTSETYGQAHLIPTPETYNGDTSFTGIRSPYDESKRASETLIYAYARNKKIDFRIARIFNTYGPRQTSGYPHGKVLANWLTSAIRSKNIVVYGKGQQTRTFNYITDCIRGMIFINQKPQAKNDVFNLGNTNEMKIIDEAKKVQKYYPKSKIVYKTLPEDDPIRRCPDIKKIKKLGWEPKIDLETGLKRTIEWFKNNTK